MVDLLLGGPGETPETVAETMILMKQIEPDCVGAALGARVYPQTRLASMLAAEGALEDNPGIQRRHDGPVDLLRPTFYVSSALGGRPAALVRELIAGDSRFFEPRDDQVNDGRHNYNDNQKLVEAIAAGARGAYWDILRNLSS